MNARLISTAIVCAALAAGACKKDDRGARKDPRKPAADAAAKEPPKTADAAPAAAVGLTFGSAVAQADVEKAFPDMTVTEEVETAEGEEIGTQWTIAKDGTTVALAHADEEKKLASVDYMAGFVGPEDLEPGATTYEATLAPLELTDCIGGAEAFAEKVFCKTEVDGLTVTFPGTADTMTMPLPPDKAAKVLKGKKVESFTISSPASLELAKRK
jgi:hypothetical protein